MKVIHRHPRTLKPYKDNVKDHKPRAIQKMCEAIRAHGMRRAIVVDKKNVIVIGHRQHAAAMKLIEEGDLCWTGAPKVPIHVADNLTPREIRELRIADNRLADDTELNQDTLAREMQDLADGFTGFDPDEWDRISDRISRQGQQDDEPEYPVSPKLGEQYDFVVIRTDNATDSAYLRELLNIGPARDYSKKTRKAGTGRAITFEHFAEALGLGEIE